MLSPWRMTIDESRLISLSAHRPVRDCDQMALTRSAAHWDGLCDRSSTLAGMLRLVTCLLPLAALCHRTDDCLGRTRARALIRVRAQRLV